MKKTSEQDLSHRVIRDLRACGHFLYYKMGGRAGRQRICAVLTARGEMPQKELQESLDIQSGSLSEILAKMASDGLIEKTRSRQDKRQLNLRLTPQGQQAAREMQQRYEARVARLLACISAQEQQELVVILDKIVNHWSTLEKNREI